MVEGSVHSRILHQHRATVGGRGVGRLVLNAPRVTAPDATAPKFDCRGSQSQSAVAVCGHDGVTQLLARDGTSGGRGLVGPDAVDELLASVRDGPRPGEGVCLGSTSKDHAPAPSGPVSLDWVDQFLAREAADVPGSARLGDTRARSFDGHAAVEALSTRASAPVGHAELLRVLPDLGSASSDEPCGASSQPESRRPRSADGRAAVARLRSQHLPRGGFPARASSDSTAATAAPRTPRLTHTRRCPEEHTSPRITARRWRPPLSSTERILAEGVARSVLQFAEVKLLSTETQWNCIDV